jgi:hypothetical protein
MLAMRSNQADDARHVEGLTHENPAESVRFGFQHHVGRSGRHHSGDVRTLVLGP